MIEIICDRCGKKIKGTTYFIIDIRNKSFCSAWDYASSLCSTSEMASNIQAAFKSICSQKVYCEECIKKIEDFIANKEKSNI